MLLMEKNGPVQCNAYLIQGNVPTSADRLSISITLKVFGEPCLMLFCFLGPVRKGVNASGIRLITGAGGGPWWVIWHGIGLNRIVVLKA